MNIICAATSHEMDRARGSLAAVLQQRITDEERHLKELQGGMEHATRQHWGTKALKRAVRKQEHRVTYYHKLLEAIQQGYVPIPNMGMDVLLLRSTARAPATAQRLPQGEGYWHDFNGNRAKPTLPVELAKPAMLRRLDEAIAEKLFDAIGVVREGADPFLVGVIYDEKAPAFARGYGMPHHGGMTFMLGWWIDVSRL